MWTLLGLKTNCSAALYLQFPDMTNFHCLNVWEIMLSLNMWDNQWERTAYKEEINLSIMSPDRDLRSNLTEFLNNSL